MKRRKGGYQHPIYKLGAPVHAHEHLSTDLSTEQVFVRTGVRGMCSQKRTGVRANKCSYPAPQEPRTFWKCAVLVGSHPPYFECRLTLDRFI